MSQSTASFSDLDDNGTKWSSHDRVKAQTTIEYKAPAVDNTPVVPKPVPPDYKQPEGKHSTGYLQSVATPVAPVKEARMHKVKTSTGEIIEVDQEDYEFLVSEESMRQLAARKREAAKRNKEIKERLAARVPDAHVPKSVRGGGNGDPNPAHTLGTPWQPPANGARWVKGPDGVEHLVKDVVERHPVLTNPYTVTRTVSAVPEDVYQPSTVKTWVHDPANGNTSAMGYHKPISRTDAHPTGVAPVPYKDPVPGRWIGLPNGATRFVPDVIQGEE